MKKDFYPNSLEEQETHIIRNRADKNKIKVYSSDRRVMQYLMKNTKHTLVMCQGQIAAVKCDVDVTFSRKSGKLFPIYRGD